MLPRDGHGLYYEARGDGPVVVLVSAPGFGSWQWAWQYPALQGPFRTVVSHPRGTGQSSSLPPPADLSTLIGDLTAVVDDLAATRVHLVGRGFGGRVGLEYTRQNDHVASLTLVQTPAGALKHGSVDETPLLGPTRDGDDDPTTSALSSAFVQTHPDVVKQIVGWREAEDAPVSYWRSFNEIRRQATREWPLYTVTTPTLIVHGGADPVVPVTNARTLAEGLPRATDLIFEDAAHLVGVERSRPVNDALVGFLEDQANWA